MTANIAAAEHTLTNGGAPKLPTQPRPLRKYEACGALCELAENVQEHLSYARDAQAKAAPDESPSMQEYRVKEIAKYERWLAALEIAGNALTK
jgi:hypothetical protein